MHLLFHQFRKDFRQVWIVWALWFFFVLVQFALAAWVVNPADLLGMGIYGQIAGMVPAIHAILLFVLIPLLVFQEPPVGTNASWLTRPMPPGTILGSKLIALGILVLVPLLGQCAALAAHHAVARDIWLAGLEIALKELRWISLATALAVLCPNFAVFLIAAAALSVLQYFSGWIWTWLAFLHLGAALAPGVPAALVSSGAFLENSRIVAADLAAIVFGLGVVFYQYFTRRTKAAILLAVGGLLTVGAIGRYWTWDFIGLIAQKPPAAAPAAFDASRLRFVPGDGHNVFEQPDGRGGKPVKTFSMEFSPQGLPFESTLSAASGGGVLAYPDGTKLELNPSSTGGFRANGFGMWFGPSSGGSDLLATEAAIGFVPILNQPFNENGHLHVQDLFTIDAETFVRKGAELGNAVFRLEGAVAGYRVAAEIPLRQGAFFAQGSKRTTLTEVLQQGDGVEIALRERSLGLLLNPTRPESGQGVTYLLLNRKRGEALLARNANGAWGNLSFNRFNIGLLSGFDLGDSRFEQFTGTRLAFHSQPGDDRPLAAPIDAAWAADAVLIRLEPESRGQFSSEVRLPDFALDGHTLPNWEETHFAGADTEALRQIVLPPHPTRPEVWRYITQILSLSGRQRNMTENDLQVEMLARVGPEHAADLLVATTVFNGPYPHFALQSLDLAGNAEAKRMLFRLVATHRELIDLVGINHWEADAKPMLLARLAGRKPGEHIENEWLKLLNRFSADPEVKQAFLDLLPSQEDVIEFVIENRWEADAKPVMIAAIARSKPGARVDDRWIRVLDGFNDDSRVKAMLLRVLPSNREAIETVVQHHWEMDAKPVLLEALAKAKPGEGIDERWFRVLANLPDLSGVKEAVLRVLPFAHNALSVVTQNHWEADALPVMLDTMAKAKPREWFDDRWFDVLGGQGDRPGVKEAVLRILPASQNAIVAVTRNQWQADAKPILLQTLDQAKPGDHFDGRWFEVLVLLPDQAGVQEAILRVLPFIENASEVVHTRHWDAEAQPLVIKALAKATAKQTFDQRFIRLAVSDPNVSGAREALLHVLPANENAIEFVTANHWEAAAAPILTEKVAAALAGQNVNRSWVRALAAVRDPESDALLLAYTEKKLRADHDYPILDDIRPLPGEQVAALADRIWQSVRGTGQERGALGPLAAWGILETLDRSAAILALPLETDEKKLSEQQWQRNSARDALNNLTPCPDRLLDLDLVAWFTAHRQALAFDPSLGRFVFHPVPIPADQHWPIATEAAWNLGVRLAAGDAGALSEIDAAIARANEGLDPRIDQGKVERFRSMFLGAAFNALRQAAATDPAVLIRIEPANRQPELRPYVAGVYGRAAEEGSAAALDALLHYETHQWALADAVHALGGLIRKGNPQAVAFAAELAANPHCTEAILNEAIGQLREPANTGNEPARAAYQALRAVHLSSP